MAAVNASVTIAPGFYWVRRHDSDVLTIVEVYAWGDPDDDGVSIMLLGNDNVISDQSEFDTIFELVGPVEAARIEKGKK